MNKSLTNEAAAASSSSAVGENGQEATSSATKTEPGEEVDTSRIYTCPVAVNMEFEVQHTIICKGWGLFPAGSSEFILAVCLFCCGKTVQCNGKNNLCAIPFYFALQLWRGGNQARAVQWLVHRPTTQKENTPTSLHSGFPGSLLQGESFHRRDSMNDESLATFPACCVSFESNKVSYMKLQGLFWICNNISNILLLQMEEIEYSCEKCNGKAATVTHKFSKLPRYAFTENLGLERQ